MRLSLVGSTVPVKSFFELRQARRVVSVIVVIIESNNRMVSKVI